MKALRRTLAIMIAAAMVMTSGVPAMATTTAPADSSEAPVVSAEKMVAEGECVEDQVLVVFDDGVRDSKIESAIESEGAECLEIAATGEETKTAVADIGENETIEEAIDRLNDNSKVLYAQPNYKYEVLSDKMTTNDPYNNDDGLNQWYLTNVKAREAWATIQDAMDNDGLELNPVTVAVIDTGADVNHEDLTNMINKEDSKQISGSELKPMVNSSDYDGHGTHVTGIIGAEANNGKGIAGVATGFITKGDENTADEYLNLIAIDATSQDYPGEYFDTYGIVTAIDYAIECGADVINMSLGGFGIDWVMEDAVEKAYEAGVTVVVASGNDGSDEAVTPADHNEVICVCNTTREDRRYEYEDVFWGGSYSSNYGQAKDISAPGSGVLSTIPASKYANYTGTSMASPVVAAAAALVYAVNDDLTPAQMKNILCATAQDVDTEGFDYYTGYGVVDIDAAIKAAMEASEDTAVESVTFKEDSEYVEYLKEGQRTMLEVLVKPATSLAEVTWSSSNEDVVTVDHKGKIYGKNAGTATITCTAGGQSASINVEVQRNNPPKEVKITNADKITEMAVNDYVTLKTEILPRYADEKSVFWKSSDQSVVTIDELGTVTARGAGVAQIMGYTHNSSYKDFESMPYAEGSDTLKASDDLRTVVVTVTVKNAVEKVKLVNAPEFVRLADKSVVFTAEVTPAYAKDADVTWSSSNRSVADIDAKTGQLKPVSRGETTITATTKNGKTAYKRITIYRNDIDPAKYGLTAKSAGYKSVKLTWKSIPYADGYIIYRGSNKIKTIEGNSKLTYTDNSSKLLCGDVYKYKVKAYYGSKDNIVSNCNFSKEVFVKPIPGTPVVKTSSQKGKITLTWGKVDGATKYEVYRYNAEKKKYVRIKTTTSTTFTNTGLNSGKTYKYKVRAVRFTTVKEKDVYGNFSKVVSRTCK